jgi:hypothetical protein
VRPPKYAPGTPVLIFDIGFQQPTRINVDCYTGWIVAIVKSAEFRAGTYGYVFEDSTYGNTEEALLISLEEINGLFAAWRQAAHGAANDGRGGR